MSDQEEPIDAARPIIDPHLHLWEIMAAPEALQAPQRFLLHDALDTLAASGHTITHSVFVECHAMYRQDGPAAMRSLGETEFVNGVAAMSASGRYGPTRIAHRIVSNVDLTLGDAAAAVLEAHRASAGERLRGIRCSTAYSAAGLFGAPPDPSLQHVMRSPRFMEGARVLARFGLSLDVWCMHTQLQQLIELASALPDLQIILDHLGTPESSGTYAGRADQARAEWLTQMRELARRPNVRVKLGGLGMDTSGPISAHTGRASSAELSARWRPYIEPCIELFSPRRCMFESNFPPDKAAGSYGVTWNAFKRIAREFSEEEKDWLFRRTAAETYRISLV